VKRVNLKAVYSKLAPKGDQESYINDCRLSLHQVRTYQLLDDRNLDVVFNTAMTGDGKSLAAYLSALRQNRCTMGLYPTNELSRDQERQIAGYVARLSLAPFKQRVCRFDAEQLTELADDHAVTRQTELLRQITDREILLANPDIYHLLMNGYYLRQHDARDKMFDPLIKNFELTVFDEFHIFSAPQIVSVVNAMLLVRATHGTGRKFLFLSATPSVQMLQYLERAGLRYKLVTGEYLHALADEASSIDPDVYRCITRQIELFFDPIKRPDKTAEAWLLENVETAILEFFRQHPGSRCAVILNSVGAVKRCVRKLTPLLTRSGLSVGENTGFSTQDERRASLSKDVLIGTSTIDIGVDFQINLLIFEATDAGNFIQRLGRLGRHAGYVNESGAEIRFTAFQAYALVPQFIHERMFEKPDELSGAPPLREGDDYERGAFFEMLRATYPPVNEFDSYAQHWGGLQSAFVYSSLERKEIKTAYEDVREILRNDYESTFKFKLDSQLSRMWRYERNPKEKAILEVARSFRGGSALQCGVIDLTVEAGPQQFKTYELPGLLTNCVIAGVLTEEDFKKRAEAAGVAISKFRFCHLFLAICDYRQEPARWRFFLPTDLNDPERNPVLDAVKVFKGFEISQTESEYENQINKRLKTIPLVNYIVRNNSFETKLRLSLPQLFPLYHLDDRYTINDPKPIYCVAFGQEALLSQMVCFAVRKRELPALIC
jgi:CRISPR-associated endonuclease/helicase Cas3